MITLKVWGGAGEHGRSCYVCAGERHRIMFDCGVKKEGKGRYPLLEASEIPSLTAVFLSHAHEDHSMALPLLYKYGYKGHIWTTRITAQQLDTYFSSWGNYVERKEGQLPYSREDTAAMSFRFIEDAAPPGQWCELREDMRLRWGRSGHLAGAAWFRLELEGTEVFFSGDYSRESSLLMADSPANLGPAASGEAALSIVDNAYGMDEESQREKLAHLRRAAEQVFETGGHLLLPVPAFGRGQEMLVWAAEQFPGCTVVAEKPVWQGLRRMLDQQEWLRPEALNRIQKAMAYGQVLVPDNDQERLRLLRAGTPCLILAADGMMESARSRWYYELLARSPANAVILTGHASRDSFARKLLGTPTDSSGIPIRYICYKVHQGLSDVRLMMDEVPSRTTLLVHAPASVTDQVCAKLRDEGRAGLHSLRPGAELDI